MKPMLMLTAVALLALNPALSAHAGHGTTDGNSFFHYLVEPQHAWFTAALLVTVTALIVAVSRARRRCPRCRRLERLTR